MNTFLIYDSRKSLMSGYPQIEAKTGSEAVKKYCKENYPNYTAKASGSNDVHISVQQGYNDTDGRAWFYGGKRKTWYQLTTKN